MKLLLLLVIGTSLWCCKRRADTAQAKMSPPAMERMWWFDVALDEERFNPNHDEERSPAPPRQKGEQVRVAVQVALSPAKRGGTMKIKYIDNPRDCELLELRAAHFYDNGDMEVSFRAVGKHERRLHGIFSEDSSVSSPYHQQFFFHLQIAQPRDENMQSLFSMNNSASFNLKPEQVREDYFSSDSTDDREHCHAASPQSSGDRRI